MLPPSPSLSPKLSLLLLPRERNIPRIHFRRPASRDWPRMQISENHPTRTQPAATNRQTLPAEGRGGAYTHARMRACEEWEDQKSWWSAMALRAGGMLRNRIEICISADPPRCAPMRGRLRILLVSSASRAFLAAIPPHRVRLLQSALLEPSHKANCLGSPLT